MLFSSLEFLYLFLPLTVALYFLCPANIKVKNFFLLTVSLLFYGFGEPVYLFLMIGTIAVNYLLGIAVERSKRRRALWLTVAVAADIALLGFFKYFDLIATTLGLSPLGLPLPIGISFYTFQALSYVIDVYRGEVSAQKNFISFGTYVSLFPQLIAGPIVRYRDVDKALLSRSHTPAAIANGIALFSAGLSKKVLLANNAGEVASSLLEGRNSTASLWLGLILYAFQIYYDFSGYSDMAVGLGRIFGFEFPRNFNYPYVSTSITDFWRRWHITLSTWFREYVYIPLGGNRRGALRTYVNLFAVWSLTGLWHGASWNFLLWGIYFFLILVIEKSFLLKLLNRLPRAVGHIYALFFILVGWLIFATEGGLSELFISLKMLFGISAPLTDGAFSYELLRNLPFLALMCLCATPLPKALFDALLRRSPSFWYWARNILTLLSLLLSTAYLVSSAYNPFLYFRF